MNVSFSQARHAVPLRVEHERRLTNDDPSRRPGALARFLYDLSPNPMTNITRPRVLVFDASPDTSDMLVEYFEYHGWTATAVNAHAVRRGDVDGAEIVQVHRPDAIVFDIALPYEEYWDVCRKLRADPRVRCPIVMTTTNVAALHRLTGAHEAAIEIVGKPYDLELLRAALSVAIGQRVPATTHDVERRMFDRRAGDRRSVARRHWERPAVADHHRPRRRHG